MIDEATFAERLFGTAESGQTLLEGNQTLLGGGQIPPPRSPEAVLFGGADTPPHDDTPRVARTEEELQDALFEKQPVDSPLAPVPKEVAELRNSNERKLFSAQDTLRTVISEADFSGDDVDPAQARLVVRELREMATDLDFGAKEVNFIKARAREVQAIQPEVISQREATVKLLNEQFGNGAKQAVRDARALLQRDPRTAKLIESLGLGDDPETVLLVARTARSQRSSGKLKTT